MRYHYRMNQVCSSEVAFDLENDRLHNVVFTGGCNGNLKAIAKLVEGMPAADVAKLLRGNTCGYKATSCADQFAKALERTLRDATK